MFRFPSIRFDTRWATGPLGGGFRRGGGAGWRDLFEFPGFPQAGQFRKVISRNVVPASLTEFRAKEMLREKVLRLIFQQGFFKLREPQIEITREPVSVHIPYWLGFYGNVYVRCRALDAIRRRFEGAKASAFFEE